MSKEMIAKIAARYMIERSETEYLYAKERARLTLGLPDSYPLPSNRQIKKCIKLFTQNEMGKESFLNQLTEMRTLAEEIMTILEENDPHLIGSVAQGTIRKDSDIDIHAYGNPEEIKQKLENFNYQNIEIETVENEKGEFSHIQLVEKFRVEITVYSWEDRLEIPYSSVTGKPMLRFTLQQTRKLLSCNCYEI